jgi:hypothetical protein
MIDEVYEPRDSECHTPSSESFKFFIYYIYYYCIYYYNIYIIKKRSDDEEKINFPRGVKYYQQIIIRSELCY